MVNPAAATRPSGPNWWKKPDVGSIAGNQGWAMLDMSILEEEPAATTTRLAIGTTSNNRAVRVSLRLAEPPASSYVQLHTDADLYHEPIVVAADGDLLLIHTAVTYLETNLFVYKANPDPEMGWLRLLPESENRTCSIRHTGIACHGKDYVVAGFLNLAAHEEDPVSKDYEDQFKEVGTISRFSSSTDQWEVVELPIPHDAENGLYKFVWESDDLFALDGFMFWVDYHRGMLYCDVFAESPSLQFIKLPGIYIWDQDHDYDHGCQLPRAYRSVGVSRGQIKFVDIDDGLFGTRKTSGFSITTWSLNMSNLEWVKDSVIEVDDLWLQPMFRDSPLPRWVPEFPVMSKQDGDIIHAILRGPDFSAKAWVITLDMGKKVLKSYRPFINERKVTYQGDEDDQDTRNTFCDTPFICCDFDWLNKTTGCPMDPIEMKWGTALTSVSGTEKRKSPYSNPDFLEHADSS